jgi:hypothetical protein
MINVLFFECGKDCGNDIPHSFILLFYSLNIYFGKLFIFI